MLIKAKARLGFRNIVVDDCPYCHRTHYHNPPIAEGVRMADCFKGEYLLDFEAAEHCLHTDPPSALEVAAESQETAGG